MGREIEIEILVCIDEEGQWEVWGNSSNTIKQLRGDALAFRDGEASAINLIVMKATVKVPEPLKDDLYGKTVSYTRRVPKEV